MTLKHVPIHACLPYHVRQEYDARLFAGDAEVKIKYYNTIYHVLRDKISVREEDVRPLTLVCVYVCTFVLTVRYSISFRTVLEKQLCNYMHL